MDTVYRFDPARTSVVEVMAWHMIRQSGKACGQDVMTIGSYDERPLRTCIALDQICAIHGNAIFLIGGQIFHTDEIDTVGKRWLESREKPLAEEANRGATIYTVEQSKRKWS